MNNELSDKRLSTQPETHLSEPKKSKRDRKLKSPNFEKSHIQEGMSLNSISSKTIEEGHGSKQIFFDNKIHMNKENSKRIRMEMNPELKSSSETHKAVFKNYTKNEQFLKKKSLKKSHERKSGKDSKNSNSESEVSSMLNNSFKTQENPKRTPKNRGITSASSIQSFQSFKKKSFHEILGSKTKTVKEYEIKEQVSNIINKNRDSLGDIEGVQRDILHTPKGIDETLSSIYSTIEENSV